MAYGDPLDPATPADNDISGQGDDRIRELKRAIRQRFLSFFIDVDADPLVPKHGSIPVDVFNDDSVDGKFLKVASVPADRVIGGGGGGGGAPGPNSVGSAQLQDHSVTNLKLGDDSVDARTIAPGAVGNSELAANSVNSANLIDGAVNRPKLVAAMRGVLGYVTKGSYVVPAGNLLAGPTYRKDINIPVAVNAVISPNAMAIVYSPAFKDSVVIAPVVIAGNIACGIRDFENQGTKDMSGTTLHWMVIQPYEGAVPE